MTLALVALVAFTAGVVLARHRATVYRRRWRQAVALIELMDDAQPTGNPAARARAAAARYLAERYP